MVEKITPPHNINTLCVHIHESVTHLKCFLNTDGFIHLRVAVVFWSVLQGAKYTTQREGTDVQEVDNHQQSGERQLAPVNLEIFHSPVFTAI